MILINPSTVSLQDKFVGYFTHGRHSNSSAIYKTDYIELWWEHNIGSLALHSTLKLRFYLHYSVIIDLSSLHD
ncbi:unnamed protein product [Rhizophagus irregularis]|nr:unnamed protein product [Rhizophagus irregularis]CAB5324170.1 unnamed protein product [Rhizophagus irregularis]